MAKAAMEAMAARSPNLPPWLFSTDSESSKSRANIAEAIRILFQSIILEDDIPINEAPQKIAMNRVESIIRSNALTTQ